MSEKITVCHLGRDAYVYVRQSTPTQVREHTESLERQYQLRERARALGWGLDQVRVIDSDLGRSGAQTTGREGFKDLVADVGLGKVGIVLGLEVSRLARNNADWYQLLDLCALCDTLIADTDGVYDPADFNDRLVLGLKGTMSEAELHLIRSRLTAGLRHKAAKGELRQGLPVGFDYDPDGNVVLSPDEAVVEVIRTVFRRFAELGSARQVLLSLREDGHEIPRRPGRTGKVIWKEATYPAVHDFLTNPAYAGAFVFGRTRTEHRVEPNGRKVTRVVQVPQEEWSVLIPEHHPGFVDWETFLGNQKTLRSNWRPSRGEGGGAPREGTALLQGRIRCGHCGRMMQTGYSGTNGDCPRYVCGRAHQLYGAERICQSLGGRRLELRVLDEVFGVLEPAALSATIGALREAETHHTARLRAYELAVERTRFQAERARRQFDACEPENRLVGRTLERAWEDRLGDARRAESELARARAHRPGLLTEDEVVWLERAGADIRAVFEAPTTTWRERKQLLRAVITEVVVTVKRAERQAEVRIIWEGGATTAFQMTLQRTGGHFRTTDEDTIDLVRRLAAHYDDTTIAVILSRQGRRTASGLNFTKRRVASLRISRQIPACRPDDVTPTDQNDPVVTADEAARILEVDRSTIYRWLKTGFITGQQLTPGAPWRIRITDQLRDKVVPEGPEGWLPLAEAAAALGVARQTVLHKVQRGELQAVHVNRGRRKGLRIQVIRGEPGLFDQP
ncbi:MAG: recombinase family protein [Acidimicrobiia bacterium]|nr:recombinase family protein [Acidimicrobiia bacterium]